MRALLPQPCRRDWRLATAREAVRSMLLVAMSVNVPGCADRVVPSSPVPSPSMLLNALEIRPRGITMAVGETVPLTVTARNIFGEAMSMPDTTPVQYAVDPTDATSQITVDPDGVVHAHQATLALLGPVRVIARWQFGGAQPKADTAYIVVTNTVPDAPATALHLAPTPDSTWFGAGLPVQVSVAAVTATGTHIPDVYAYVFSDRRRRLTNDPIDPATGTLSTLAVGLRPGARFWVHATAVVYGVVLEDSVQYLMTDPVLGVMRISADLAGQVSATVSASTFAPCGQVFVNNSLAVPIRVTFADPAATSVCAEGDETGPIVLPPNQGTVRKFRTPGTYQWTVTRDNGTLTGVPFRPAVTGTIRIRAHTEW